MAQRFADAERITKARQCEISKHSFDMSSYRAFVMEKMETVNWSGLNFRDSRAA